MKFTVDVDCTPEEARRFLGLPDLTPVHQAYIDKTPFRPDIPQRPSQWCASAVPPPPRR